MAPRRRGLALERRQLRHWRQAVEQPAREGGEPQEDDEEDDEEAREAEGDGVVGEGPLQPRVDLLLPEQHRPRLGVGKRAGKRGVNMGARAGETPSSLQVYSRWGGMEQGGAPFPPAPPAVAAVGKVYAAHSGCA